MNKKSLKTLSALIGFGTLFGTLIFPTYVTAVKKDVSKAIKTLPHVKNNLKRKSTDDDLKFCKSTKKLKIINETNGYGIYNRNNNCYMNALLQLFYNINNFRNWILNFKSFSDDNSNTQKINAMHHLFNHISGKKRLNLKILNGYLKTLGHQGFQEDPQEYIQLQWSGILDLFKNKKFKNINPNDNYIFTNPLCISEVNGNFLNLIPHTIGNQFVILLNRTLFDKGIYKKDTSPLNNINKDLLSTNGKHKYKITGAIIHSGKNIFDGHYYFYRYNNIENKWYVYNDSFVNQVTESEVFDHIKSQSVAILYTDVSEL